MTRTPSPEEGRLSQRAFCELLSARLSHADDPVVIEPGDHVVDDLGFDSLKVLEYVVLLDELGCDVNLDTLDPELLEVDAAFVSYAADPPEGSGSPATIIDTEGGIPWQSRS